MKRFFSLLSILLVITFVAVGFASVPSIPESPYAYVIDLAGIIAPDMEALLNSYLRMLQQKTTAQIVILTIESLQGESIEEFSIKVAEQWKLGQKNKDNGVLITIAVKDRKYRFEVGYGLEPVLPDSFVGTLGRKYFVPLFKQGRFSEGIWLATRAIAEKIAQAEGKTLVPPEELTNRPIAVKNKKIGLVDILFGGIFLVVAILLFIRHPWLFIFLMMGGGRGGGWSTGGDGFGGFGGGGGGGFGGGGASGGW